MSFSELPEEVLLQILNEFNDEPEYAQQFVMLHVNKFCARTTTHLFKNKPNAPMIGRDNLLIWSCKSKNLSLVKWAQTFNQNFSFLCFIEAIKNNNFKLVNYLFLVKCPIHYDLLGTIMYYNKKQLFDYFISMQCDPPDGYDEKYFEINKYTFSYLIQCLAEKGNYKMLKYYLRQYSYHFQDKTFRYVLMSKYMNNTQKLKILKLLANYQKIDDTFICSYAIDFSDDQVLKWLLGKRCKTINSYHSAAYKRNTKAIIILLEHGVGLSNFDVGYIKFMLEGIENDDVHYILESI